MSGQHNSPPLTWQEFRNGLIVRALKDEGFRRELLAAPKVVLEKEMSKVMEGTKLPAAWEVKVIEQPANAIYLILPTFSGDELSEEELDSIVGDKQVDGPYYTGNLFGDWE